MIHVPGHAHHRPVSSHESACSFFFEAERPDFGVDEITGDARNDLQKPAVRYNRNAFDRSLMICDKFQVRF